MSELLSRMLSMAATVLALVLAMGVWTSVHGGARPAAAAVGPDSTPQGTFVPLPLAVGQALIAAVNAGDGAAAAALFADDGWFQVIDGGSFGAFGRTAVAFAFQDIGSQDNAITIVSSSVSGNTVTGVVHTTDNDARTAEVDRYVQPFTLVVENGEIKSLDLRYDMTDAQTQTYLAYQAEQRGDNGPPERPDLLALSMAGSQAGQVHAGTVGTGVIVAFFELATGPEGVLQPAAIYHGSCGNLGARLSPLAPVEGGYSGSFVAASLPALVEGGYAVAVHASQTDTTVVSCGNIVRVAAPTPASTATPLPALASTGTGGASDGGASDGGALSWLLGMAALGATGVASSVLLRRRS